MAVKSAGRKMVQGGANKTASTSENSVKLSKVTTANRSHKRKSKLQEEEIESDSDGEVLSEGGASQSDELESEDEDGAPATETPAEKRIRLAKAYVTNLQNTLEDEDNDDAEELNVGNRDSRVSEHLLKELRESRGYQQKHLASQLRRPSSTACTVTRGHGKPVTALALTRDASTCYTTSKDGAIVQWDMSTGTKQKFHSGEVSSKYSGPAYPGSFAPAGQTSARTILAAAVTYDGKYLAVAGMDRRVHVWETTSRTHVTAFPGHKDIVSSLAFRDGSHLLYSGSFDRTVKQWSLEEMMYLDTLYGHQAEVTALDCDTRERPVSVSRDHTCRLWKVQDETHLVFRGKGSLDCCCVVGSGNWVSGADDGALALWGMTKKKPVAVRRDAHSPTPALGPAAAWIGAVASVRGSDVVASGAADGFIRLWSLGEDNNRLSDLYSMEAQGFVNALQFSRDGRLLVGGIGQEPRLGRWARDSKAKNGLWTHRLETV